MTALCAAIALFVGSGPVAHHIGRRRWLLALPIIGAAIWAAGIAIAYLT